MTTAADQQPVEALGADCTDPAFRVGVAVGRLRRPDEDIAAFRPEDVVEGAGELRIPVADQKPPRPSTPEHQQQVAGLLANPGRRVQRLGRVGDLRIRMEMCAQDCDASPEPSAAKGTRVLSRLAYLTLAGTSSSLTP